LTQRCRCADGSASPGTEFPVDWTEAKRAVLPNLKPSTQSISIRLPVDLLEQIKVEASRRDVPHQSLIKIWLSEHARKNAA